MSSGGGGADSERVIEPLPGISLEGIRRFVDVHGGRASFESKTTREVKNDIIKLNACLWGGAWTAELARTADGANICVGKASVFVSHIYEGRFLDAMDALEAWEKRQAASCAFQPFFYFFDLLVVDQRQGACVPFEVLRDTFGPGVRSASRVLLLLDEEARAMTRLWCVFEIATACEEGLPLEVILPPREEAKFVRELEQDYEGLCRRTMTVNAERATAEQPEDERNIRAVLTRGGGVGYLRASQLVVGCMQRWMGERALAALPANEDRGTSALILNLAKMLQDHDKLGEAEPLFREALATRRRKLGDEHPDTLTSIDKMAGLLKKQDKLGEAELLYEEAFTGRKRAHDLEQGRDTLVSMLTSMSNKAGLFKAQDRLDEAEPLFREALKQRRHELGDEHRDTLVSISNMAGLLKAQGKLVEAEKLYREVLGTRTRLYGKEDPRTLASICNMAPLLLAQENLGEAEELLRFALDTRRRIRGEEHHDTLISMNFMAVLLRQKGERLAAKELLEKALKVRRLAHGDGHRETKTCERNLCELLRDMGDLNGAAALT